MASKPLWYHLFYSSTEELQKVLENRTIKEPIKRTMKNFSYHEDMGFAANEYLINNFPPINLIPSFGYIEPDVIDTSYLNNDDWDEEAYLKELEAYDHYDKYNDSDLEDETEYVSSSSDEYDEDDEWTTI